MSCAARVYPLNQPKGWEPKVPRWMLELPDHVKQVAVAYIGVQKHDENQETLSANSKAALAIEQWLHDDREQDAPLFYEKLTVISGFDVPDSLVWICYWITGKQAQSSLQRLKLDEIAASLGSGSASLGLWRESYIAEVPRFETNYSGTDYRPGIAKLPESKHIEHLLTGYWGAARDRIPASAYDRFDRADGDNTTPDFDKHSRQAHLTGTNRDTIVHIRSGQFWGNCSPVEAEAYTTKLEPALRTGLAYLEDNPRESGDFGLRFLRNLPLDAADDDGSPRPETCGAGFFRNLADLERWAKGHPSHHAIYGGAIKHAREFAKDYRLRTWHEVSVLKPGEASFDYLNCTSRTGMIPFENLDVA